MGARPALIAMLVFELVPGLTLVTMSAGMAAARMAATVGVFLGGLFGMEALWGAAAVRSLTVVSAAKEMEAAGLLRPGR